LTQPSFVRTMEFPDGPGTRTLCNFVQVCGQICVQVCASPCLLAIPDNPGRTRSLCNFVQVCGQICEPVFACNPDNPGRTRDQNFVQLCSSLCKSVQVCASLCKSVQVCASPCLQSRESDHPRTAKKYFQSTSCSNQNRTASQKSKVLPAVIRTEQQVRRAKYFLGIKTEQRAWCMTHVLVLTVHCTLYTVHTIFT